MLFWLGRLFFILFNVRGFSFNEAIAVAQHSFRIDVSSICYLLLLPFLLSVFHRITVWQGWSILFKVYFYTVTAFVVVLNAIDVCLYQEWGAKINSRIFLYLQHPSEVLNSASFQHYLIFGLVALVSLLFIQYTVTALSISQYFEENKGEGVVWISPLIAILLLVGIRGGWQQIPMQESDCYFSKEQKINDVTVNTFWNFNASLARSIANKTSNPYHYLTDKELARYAEHNFDYAMEQPETKVLKSARPNVVFLILEGWSADMVGCVSGNIEQSASPMFDSLSKQGVLFSECYASGDRSDQGITTVLTSFPALPFGSIINESQKIKKLPSVSTSLHAKGYQSLFLFGGDLSYGNLKALIYQKGFDEIIEEKDINPNYYRGRLGVHDEHTFELFRQKISAIHQPFFASIFTQSTHFHYDYPHQRNTITWAGEHNAYANSMLYSDSCIGDFFRKAKQESWYSNTLFVLVPDHSHHSPNNSNPKTADYHHIPLLLYGDVLNDSLKGKVMTNPVSQCDLAGTVVGLITGSAKEFEWSNNLFLSIPNPHVYFIYTEGVGVVKSKDCKLSFDAKNNRLETSPSKTDCDTQQMLQSAKAYLQYVYNRYLQY
jgi:phosphoglycerol transferase MdoB-like AlkP superfamily enzyme